MDYVRQIFLLCTTSDFQEVDFLQMLLLLLLWSASLVVMIEEERERD